MGSFRVTYIVNFVLIPIFSRTSGSPIYRLFADEHEKINVFAGSCSCSLTSSMDVFVSHNIVICWGFEIWIKNLVVDASRRVRDIKSFPLLEKVESSHSFLSLFSTSSCKWRKRTEVTQSINSFAELSLKIPSLVQAIRCPPMSPRIESHVEVFSSDKYGKTRKSLVFYA